MLYQAPKYFEKKLSYNQTMMFRPFQMKEDFERLHEWMHKQHVIPFWQLNVSVEKFKDHMEKAEQDEHQTLWIGCLNEEPMSYWETYDVKDDIVGNYYHYQPTDRGIHLLIGPESYLGKGLAQPLVQAMLDVQFERPNVNKVVAEPDIKNKKMIHVFKKCGFQPVKPIDLPDKTGLLMICHREEWKRRKDSNE